MITAGAAGQTVFARRMEARQGRDAQRLDAKHDSLAPRSGDAPCGQRNGDDTITTRSITACAPTTTPSPPATDCSSTSASSDRTPNPHRRCRSRCEFPPSSSVPRTGARDRSRSLRLRPCLQARAALVATVEVATSASRTFRSVQATALSAERREMRTVTMDPLRPTAVLQVAHSGPDFGFIGGTAGGGRSGVPYTTIEVKPLSGGRMLSLLASPA